MELAQHDSIAHRLADGQLGEAVEAVVGQVKQAPTDTARRVLLADLLALQGAYERADNHLKIASDQAAAEQIWISQTRWLLRGLEARKAWYEQGAVPSFIGEPTPIQRDAMQLALHLRDGDTEGTAALLRQMEDRSASPMGVDGGKPAEGRDVCDLCQHGFEALTLDGRYLWIAPDQIAEMRLAPVQRPRDLLWRKAETALADGRDATFFLVVQYYDAEASDAQRLAKETDWIACAGGVMRGRGQKMLLVGDESRGLLDIAQITTRP